jgi:hypothetical protein
MTDATLLTTGKRPAVRLERHLPDPPACGGLSPIATSFGHGSPAT